MNELRDAENLWIEVSNNELKFKKKKKQQHTLLLQTVAWTNQREKRSWREMRRRTKSGLDGTFIKLMACQQDTDEYFCRIKMATQV